LSSLAACSYEIARSKFQDAGDLPVHKVVLPQTDDPLGWDRRLVPDFRKMP
jgi:hypothetical protein